MVDSWFTASPGPESDWLDSGVGWGCTPVVHGVIMAHRINQPSPHTLRREPLSWQHVTSARLAPACRFQ